jgi:hypothetical protein
MLHKILYDLSNERKIGRNLKGLSKLVLGEIEAKVWEVVELEIQLFHKDEELRKCHEAICKNLYGAIQPVH